MTQLDATYVAMWSGPRNISTALLRSWGSRPDTFVCDEPFYAHYLRETGIEHPGREAVLASQENDWHRVVEQLTSAIPHGKAIFYQKHMAHHLLPKVGRAWMTRVTNAFLIRKPSEMLTSLLAITPDAEVEDTGLPQQWEMFQRAREETGLIPAVIDARDVLENPSGILTKLCAAVGVPFLDAMLSWGKGPRETDGVWAPFWYSTVEESTGFGSYVPKNESVPPDKQAVLEKCDTYYQKLYDHRLRV